MQRCLELALLGSGHVAPNPMVGAVLVYDDPLAGERIIGEGYHRQYGQAHAEVNCIRSVKETDRPFIRQSTLYVSLEPCAHFGKTPPCADLVIEQGIPKVVVGVRDPFPLVDGKGIEKLRKAGVAVETGILERECREMNRRFFLFNTRHRPYIVLKWAQSADGKIAGAMTPAGRSRILISNEYTNRLVHKWRTEEASILVGTNTALADDPALTARLWKGPDPVRLVIDRELRLPSSLRLFDGQVRTLVFNNLRHEEGTDCGEAGLSYYQLAEDSSLVHQVATALYQRKIQSVLIEGGARLLQSFIDADHWDEARVITNEELVIPGGLPAPELPVVQPFSREKIFSDTIRTYKNPNPTA